MDVKTLYALTKGVGSLRNHGCEDCVSTDPGGGILGFYGFENFARTDPGGEIFEISWM